MKNRKQMFLLYLMGIIFLFAGSSHTSVLEVPERIQVGMFSKIFQYDKALKGKKPIKILVVYNDKSNVEKERLVKSFQMALMEVESTRIEDLNDRAGQFDVIYFMPELGQFSEICKIKKVLTISASSKDTETGNISIALGLISNQPRIFVNMSSLKKEGHELSAKLLKIAIIKK